jgi:antitoxin component YwqK of YwqJK toxin-antitoxin module
MVYVNGLIEMVHYTKYHFMQDKQPHNNTGQAHGLWETYYDNGQLCFKGTYINGIEHGPWITYYENGQLRYKITYILGERDGLFQWYYLHGTIREIEFYAR